MRASDIAGMCLQNLKRRRARTILTALGVLVGTCSIVIMVSIGLGLSEEMDLSLSQMGDLTEITVNAPQSSLNSDKTIKLNDEALSEIEKIDNVQAVCPKMSLDTEGVSFRLYAGTADRYVYEGPYVVGMRASALSGVGYAPAQGEQLTGSASGSSKVTNGGTIDVLVGQYFAYDFADTYRSEGDSDRYRTRPVDLSSSSDGLYEFDETITGAATEGSDPFFDALTEKSLALVALDSDGNETARFNLRVVGTLTEDWSKGSETSDGLIMDVSDARAIIAQLTGKTPTLNYSEAIVKVDDISNVADVEEQIKALGLSTYSMESIRKPMEEQSAQSQLMLGGLGAISLLVAAIGITNTMVMSITERTREIGVMKALGCYVRDIRTLFLAEAASIGFMGGVAGCVVSFVISLGMNLVSKADFSPESWQWAIFGGDGKARMSVIPWWLYIFAVVFSVLIGLISGYYPARKATKISAIEAIRQ